jgi:Na+/H+-dicarboxylate symporter/ABC-type amino acid transport substrate-binding protein
MVLGTVLGILAGLTFGDYCNIFAPWTSAYIMILKITTIPYLFIAIIHGIGQLHTSQALQILKKGLLFIAIAWAINILMIYAAVFLFPHAGGFSLTHYTSSNPTALNFSELLIPENIFYSLSNNIVPSVVVFSLLVGISLMHIKEKAPFMRIMEALVDSLTKITSWISRITPFGTFLIIAYQVGTIQLSTVKQVSTYIIVYILIICLIVFWIFPRLVSSLTNIRAYRWIKDLSPILILGYTTNVVIVCLPFIIELIKRELQHFFSTDERTQSQIQGIVSVTFNLPLGSLFITIFIFFISIFYGSFLNFTGQLQLFISSFLVSLGSVGLGSLINSLGFILATIGLPQEAVTIFLTTLPFTSGFQAMVSVMEIASLSLLITLSCHRLMVFKFTRLVRKSLFTAGPVLLLLIAIKSHNPLPSIQNCTPSIYEIEAPSSIILSQGVPSQRQADSLYEILRTKNLRVGFNPNISPFCFKNQWGQLSGYDIAFARQLGQDLGCEVTFVPMNYDTIAEQLQRGEFDIAMSAVSINEDRLEKIYFTEPYLESKLVFVVKEKDHKQFSKPNAVEIDRHVKIAVFKGSIYECIAKTLYPNHRLVTIDDYEKFPDTDADILLWAEIQAIAWLTRHGGYTLITPDPSLGIDLFSYAIPQGSDVFLNYLNLWLTLKKNEGFSQHQYDLWILGKTETINPPEQRWSILRDVLHWID